MMMILHSRSIKMAERQQKFQRLKPVAIYHHHSLACNKRTIKSSPVMKNALRCGFLLCGICSLAFSFTHRATFLHRPAPVKIQHGAALPDLGDLLSGEDLSVPSAGPSTELWLDLRGTATHPKAATDYLLEELQEDGWFLSDEMKANLIGKVLIADRSFQNLLIASDAYVGTSEILYITDDKNEGQIALSRNGLSFPFGTLVAMPTDNAVAVPDPMRALETLTDGRWVVLCNEAEGVDSDKDALKMEAIGTFLGIASIAWGVQNLDSGLVLRTASQDEDKAADSPPGGVAVVCSTKSSVMQLASILQCFQSGTTSATESGILIQGSAETSEPFLPTALILPFDVMLWKAALLVYGVEQSDDIVLD
jgi:hypothetical protein